MRAGDQKALIFSDLSQIHGTLSSSMSSQLTLPFGPYAYTSSSQNSAQLGPFTLTTGPTFDVAPLNTKLFTEGIMRSVDAGTLAFYFNAGDCRAVPLLLFIQRIDEYEVVLDDSGKRQARLVQSDLDKGFCRSKRVRVSLFIREAEAQYANA
jgi:hypothetical protein